MSSKVESLWDEVGGSWEGPCAGPHEARRVHWVCPPAEAANWSPSTGSAWGRPPRLWPFGAES